MVRRVELDPDRHQLPVEDLVGLVIGYRVPESALAEALAGLVEIIRSREAR